MFWILFCSGFWDRCHAGTLLRSVLGTTVGQWGKQDWIDGEVELCMGNIDVEDTHIFIGFIIQPLECMYLYKISKVHSTSCWSKIKRMSLINWANVVS